MLDLEEIKARRAAIGKANWSVGEPVWPKNATILYLGENHRVPIYGERKEANGRFIAYAPTDIDLLVAEVERLRADRDEWKHAANTRVLLLDDIQLCGHPRSAIVTGDDLGSPGTSWCGMCEAEAKIPGAQKPGWKLPEPPKCEHGETAIAAVNFTGDSWIWGWHTDCCGPDPFNWGDDGEKDMLGERIEWPFVGNEATSDDWKRAGLEEM